MKGVTPTNDKIDTNTFEKGLLFDYLILDICVIGSFITTKY